MSWWRRTPREEELRPRIAAALVELFQARSKEAYRRVLTAHVELLDPAMERMTESLLDELAAAQRSPEARDQVERNRELLRRCRQTGIDGALGEEEQKALPALLLRITQPAPSQTTGERAALCREVLELLERDAGSDPFVRALAQWELGSCLAESREGSRSENLERAIAAFEAALSILTRELHPEEWAAVQMNLGNAYADRLRGERAENLEKAIAAHQRALTVRSRDAMPREWAQSQRNLGVAYRQRLRGDRAENLERALEACEAALEVWAREGSALEWAVTQMHLGAAYRSRLRGDRAENLEKAIAAHERALPIFTAQAREFERATCAMNLANSYALRRRGSRTENLERAIALYHTALEGRTRAEMPVEWGQTQANLGSAHLARGEVAPAIAAFERALEVQTRETMPLQWAETLFGLAQAHCKLPEAKGLAKAVEELERALTLLRPDAWPERSRDAATALGRLRLSQGDAKGALAAFRTAIEAADNLYRASLLWENRQAEVTEQGGLHQLAAWAAARAGLTADAAVLLERGRARQIGEILARDRADLEDVQAQHPASGELYRAAAARLRRLAEEDLAAAAGEGRRDPARFAEAARAWEELRAVVERIRRLPGHQDFLVAADLAEIARAVRPGVPCVYLFSSPAGGLALLLVAGSAASVEVEAVWSDLGSADLDGLLGIGGGADGELLSGLLGRTVFAEKALARALSRLGPWMAEIASRLRRHQARAVVLIPCGRLALLPLQAAPFGEGGTTALLDELDVSFAPSARVWSAVRPAAGAAAGAPVLAGVGDPRPHPRPLPGAGAELDAIGSLFRPESRRVLLGEQATREALLRALPGATHVHFACHATFDARDPLASRLELANGEGLTLGEVMEGAKVRAARLVVLSACQTALSEFNELRDEAIGFPAGFLQAGAAAVLGTLWPVDDRVTLLLMRKFYQLLLGSDPLEAGALPPAAALRRAQLWLRDLRRDELERLPVALREAARHLTAHAPAASAPAPSAPETRPFASRPYYWAPFVLVGE